MEDQGTQRVVPRSVIHPERGAYTWAFHDSDEIGPVMLSKISKKTGLKREDL